LRGLRVDCLGDPYRSVTRHPPLDSVKQGRFDGLITIGIYDENWLARLLKLGIPTVIVDHPARRFGHLADQVYVDPQTGYGAAVDHYLERGKRRIHFVGQYLWETAPDTKMSWKEWQLYRIGRETVNVDSFLRLTAVRQSLLEHGIELPEQSIHYVSSRPEALSELAEQLMGLPRGERPEVVIAHGIDMVSRLVERFRERGLALEGAGAGSTRELAEDKPAVAVIHLQRAELGTVAADLLRARIQRPDRLFLNVGVRTRFEPARA
jgi:DNA-binding LacI/PurR family transcriptional regulator